MAYLVQGDSSTAQNPVLVLYTAFDGFPTDVYSLSFQIFDLTTPANLATFTTGNPNDVQIFPQPPGATFALDVVHLWNAAPTPGNKLGAGNYFAPWTAGPNVDLGNYAIKWTFQRTSTSAFRSYTDEFVVIASDQVTTGSPIVARLQLFMQDFFQKNQLLDALEYTPQQYDLALYLSCLRFNMIPVPTSFEVDNIPPSAYYAMFLGGAGHLLRSTSIEQLRNQLTYTDGNIHVGLTDKHALYLAAGNQFLGEFDQMTRQWKNSFNIDDGYGDVSSPYDAPLGGWGNSGFGWGWG
jgi:hypothetical protein